MSRPKMLPGTRPSKEMLSTRIPAHLYDRTRAYAISSRFTIEEITTAALDAYLDAQAPETKARYQPEPEPAAPVLPTAARTDDARIDRLEQMLETLLKHQATPAPAADHAPAKARRKA